MQAVGSERRPSPERAATREMRRFRAGDDSKSRGSWRWRLAHRQPEPGKPQLLVLRFPQRKRMWNHNRGDRLQLRDRLSRFIEPAHMGVAARERSVRRWVRRALVNGKLQLGGCSVE